MSNERMELVRCLTPWCRNPLGVRLPGDVVRWDHPVEQDDRTGETHITCSICGSVRTWHRRERPKFATERDATDSPV